MSAAASPWRASHAGVSSRRMARAYRPRRSVSYRAS
jgi:hypothetical protein